MQIVEDRAVRQLRILVDPYNNADKAEAIQKFNYTFGEGRFLMSTTRTKDGKLLMSALEA